MADHRWSGWPGAWCLDCGQEDKRELCLADGHDLGCDRRECKNEDCPEPGSNRYNPYMRGSS